MIADAGRATCALTVDVEDWYHILDDPASPPVADWDRLPARVEQNVDRLLTLLDAHGVRATFFVLSWLAERHPDMVRRIHSSGHEIASHGCRHELVHGMTREEFARDLSRSRTQLATIIGAEVPGYRAAGFSASSRTPWFLEEVAAAGYRYDASIFPGRHGHGGWPDAELAPHVVQTASGPLYEFPASLVRMAGVRLCLSGGGYLRLFPYALIRSATRRIHAEGRTVVFYVHPREIDPGQPRLPLRPWRRFKSYVNLKTTEPKLVRLFADFTFRPLIELVDADPAAAISS